MTTSATATEKSRLAERFDLWVQERVRRRRGPIQLPHTFAYRHIYVMPTRFGFWFAMLLVLTVVGGLNFNNNMALMLGFLLAAIAQLTTLLAYRNLEGVTVRSITAAPVFAGDRARFRALLANDEERTRYAIQGVSPESDSCTDIEAQNSALLTLEQPTWRRGWARLEPFRIENRYPLGLFRAWSVIIPDAKCLVYPMPAVNPPQLPKVGHGDSGTPSRGEGDHFHGLREYKPGDTLHRIAWRTSARHQKLYTREMESPVEDACELNWYLMGGGDTEEKLSILTAWVLRAERLQIPYSLEMPGNALPADLGDEHRDTCLQILALFEQ